MHSSKRAPLVADRNDPHDCVIAYARMHAQNHAEYVVTTDWRISSFFQATVDAQRSHELSPRLFGRHLFDGLQVIGAVVLQSMTCDLICPTMWS